MRRALHDVIYAIVFGAFKVLAAVTGVGFAVVEAIVGPLPDAVRISLLILGMIATGVGVFVVFRAARRPTCHWPRPLRIVAQAPGWLLVPAGALLVIGLAKIEIDEHRVGLGTGTLAAVVSATIKGVWLAYGRRDESS